MRFLFFRSSTSAHHCAAQIFASWMQERYTFCFLRQTNQKRMASNAFHALKDSDSDSDDEDSVFRSDADKLEKKANNLFLQAFAQNQTFSFSAQAAKETTLAGVKNQGESSLSSMANVLDSLGDDVKQLTRKVLATCKVERCECIQGAGQCCGGGSSSSHATCAA